jgi:hypothetical protein
LFLVPCIRFFGARASIGHPAEGQLDNAIKDYDEAIRLDPKYTDAFFNRGFAWTVKKDYDKAPGAMPTALLGHVAYPIRQHAPFYPGKLPCPRQAVGMAPGVSGGWTNQRRSRGCRSC